MVSDAIIVDSFLNLLANKLNHTIWFRMSIDRHYPQGFHCNICDIELANVHVLEDHAEFHMEDSKLKAFI